MLNQLYKFLENRGFVLGGSLNRNDRAGALHKAWGHIFTNHIVGDYVEFGVYQGNSFIESYKQKKIFDKWLKSQISSSEEWRRIVASNYVKNKVYFHGLDTFEGMPENEEGNKTFAKGTYFSNYDSVRTSIMDAGLDKSEFYLYKGLFSDSSIALKRNLSNKLSIVNIDCDIYQSAIDALNLIEDNLQIGSVLMFDDYNAFCANNKKGERRAFSEFQKNAKFKFEPWFSYHYSGQTFLCVEE